MTKRKTIEDTHHAGLYTGYELRDGKYYIAPTYKEEFRRLDDDRRGLEELLRLTNGYVSRGLTVLVARNRDLWEHLENDFGVKLRGWRYNHVDGCIEPIPPEKTP